MADSWSYNQNSVYPATIGEIKIYRLSAFDLYPNVIHAIFTRQGGYSQQPYHSLNLSVAVGDHPDTVKKNFKKACQAVQVQPKQTASSYLIHGTDILPVHKNNQQQQMGIADGLITNEPDIFLFMRFGDCTPLIFYDPVQKAVGLTHAGWRGTMKNAAGATIKAMRKNFGSQAQNIIAAIGPAIGPCCYEVGPDVIAAATESFTDITGLFVRPNTKTGHAYFDMWKANQQQLTAAGVEQIILSNLCTACRTDEFFSHRAEKGETGRFGVIIGLKEAIL